MKTVTFAALLLSGCGQLEPDADPVDCDSAVIAYNDCAAAAHIELNDCIAADWAGRRRCQSAHIEELQFCSAELEELCE